jgi:hypothetical protein
MSKLSKRDTLFLVAIGILVVLGGMYWFYVKPARADLTTTTAAAADAQARVDQLSVQLQALTAAAKRPSKVTIADELLLAKAYPYSRNVPIAILQLEDVAKKSHVELSDATPDAGTDYAGVTGTSFSISVTGKFFDVQDFIHRLHSQVLVTPSGKLKVKGRLLAVTKAELSPAGGGGEAGAPTGPADEVTASVTIVMSSRAASGAGGGSATEQPTGNPAPANNSGGNS